MIFEKKGTGSKKGWETSVVTPYSHWVSGMASKGGKGSGGNFHLTHDINNW